jgi:hypothetical protein
MIADATCGKEITPKPRHPPLVPGWGHMGLTVPSGRGDDLPLVICICGVPSPSCAVPAALLYVLNIM